MTKSIISTFLLLSFIYLLSSCSTTNLDKGLIVYLPMNGETKDVSKNKSKIIFNGTSTQADRFGEPEAYKFKPGNYIEIDNKHLLPKSGSTLSISVWININYAKWRGMRIADKTDAGEPYGFCFDTYTNGGSGLRCCIAGTCCESDIPLAYKEWVHAVFIFNKGEYIFYVNGREGGKGKTRHSYFADISKFPLVLGKGQGALSRGEYFDGAMDDFRLYDRVISKREVLKLYNEGDYPTMARSATEQRVNEEIMKIQPESSISIIDINAVDIEE